jgi:hypothetical protein
VRAAGLLLAALLASCGSGAEDCVIEHVVADRLADVDHVDCGQLASFDETTYRAAHDCVAAAVVARQYFSVIWDQPGIDSRIAGAYLGLPGEADFELQALHFDGDPSGGNQIGEVTNTSHCDSLTDNGTCALYDLGLDLCFACAGERGLPQCNAAD